MSVQAAVFRVAADPELLDTGLEGREGAPPLALVVLIGAAHCDHPHPSKDVTRGFLGPQSQTRTGAHARRLESERRTVAHLAAGPGSRLWTSICPLPRERPGTPNAPLRTGDAK